MLTTHAGVDTVNSNEILVSAGFGDHPILQDDDLVLHDIRSSIRAEPSPPVDTPQELCGKRYVRSMTVRIGDIVIDCQDARLAAEFWCAALGHRITETDDTGVAVAGDSSVPTMLFLHSTDSKTTKNRMHFDVCPTEGSTRDDEVARLESLGATRIDIGQADASWIVMADPDGNEFCVMSTVVPPEPAPFHHL